ncbi:MAG: carbamoyltransferase HypF [Candidatus Obscuribacterales bacterium]|nr:carbamoyltransferase HypF [Candidatus Obscuribacterales bacterium]
MDNKVNAQEKKIIGKSIRVRGLVQGVGFRPRVWTIARELGIKGSVINDSEGVLIEAWGTVEVLSEFQTRLQNHGLALAQVEKIESQFLSEHKAANDFLILRSQSSNAKTRVAADAASCAACLEEILDSRNRRYRYPFTNCTHCGPRLTIIKAIPYDRGNTSMSSFDLCVDCAKEYEDPQDRRYHAQPTACRRCGPQTELLQIGTELVEIDSDAQMDELDMAAALLREGKILAIKGLGGFHLACDAENPEALAKLRQRKMRDAKPLALMARDLNVIRKYCNLSKKEEELLSSSEAPIVILEKKETTNISALISGEINTLGFMLPYTPLHHLLMKSLESPIVLSSANLSDEPQCIENEEARKRLHKIADYMLQHNREIVNRVDDSVLRVLNEKPLLLRRGRGYAPGSFRLPADFSKDLSILAMGSELKNTLCLLKDDSAILTQHIGDLKEALTFNDYKKNLALYEKLFQHEARQIAVDMHPEYLSTKYGKELAGERAIDLHLIQHHHAHIAACLAENNHGLHDGPVLGIALDGLGMGDDGSLWGAEFLLADYCKYQRLASFKAVSLIGGSKAMLEPWRNTYAHIEAAMGFEQFQLDFGDLELCRFFKSKAIKTFEGMLRSNTNVPKASSCGRLFDAVAAAIGICREKITFEGQAAMELEAIVDRTELLKVDESTYRFSISKIEESGLLCIDPGFMWQALLQDLSLNTPAGVIAARFHKSLANVIAETVESLTCKDGKRILNTIAVSGGVFQNKILTELLVTRLQKDDYRVFSHGQIPAGDGGIALGQAMICAAGLSMRG